MKQSVAAASLLFVTALFCQAQVVDLPTDTLLRLQVSRNTHRVTLYRGDRVIKSYPVAVGRAGWETPLGTFQIYQMLEDPAWEHPLTGKVFPPGDPGNELGRYWIGFAKEGDNCVGFHGTSHPQTVGKSLSHGCIRMYEKDIEELFLQVNVGTIVTVVP